MLNILRISISPQIPSGSFALTNPPCKIFWCLIQCSLHCPTLISQPFQLYPAAETTGWPPASLIVLSYEWMGSWWIDYSIVVASFPSFSSSSLQKGHVGSLLSRACSTGRHSPVCAGFPVACGGSRGYWVVEETASGGRPTPALSAQCPPWEPARCCLAAVPKASSDPNPMSDEWIPNVLTIPALENEQALNFHSSVGRVWERTLPFPLSWVLRRDTCRNADPKSWILTGVSGTFLRVRMSGQADVWHPAKEEKVPAPFHSWHCPQTNKIEGDVLPCRTPRASAEVTQTHSCFSEAALLPFHRPFGGEPMCVSSDDRCVGF